MTLSPIQGASREWSLLGLKPIARYGSNALIYSNKDYMSCLNLLALGNALSESTTMGWVCVCVSVCVCGEPEADRPYLGAAASKGQVLCRRSSKSSSAPWAWRHTSSAEPAASAAASLEGSAWICALHPDINRRTHTYSTQYIPIVCGTRPYLSMPII